MPALSAREGAECSNALLLAQAQQNRNSSLTRFLTVRTEAFKLNGGCFSSLLSLKFVPHRCYQANKIWYHSSQRPDLNG
jgi:hypothetical protein